MKRLESQFAISIKQPWAALLVHGCKSIEVRRWRTLRRGQVLIHASRQIDARDVIWSHVPSACLPLARLRGGIIGAAHLIDCLTYRTRKAFAADSDRHLNDPRWFTEPVMYGFVMANNIKLPFWPYPGWVRFFEVTVPPTHQLS